VKIALTLCDVCKTRPAMPREDDALPAIRTPRHTYNDACGICGDTADDSMVSIVKAKRPDSPLLRLLEEFEKLQQQEGPPGWPPHGERPPVVPDAWIRSGGGGTE